MVELPPEEARPVMRAFPEAVPTGVQRCGILFSLRRFERFDKLARHEKDDIARAHSHFGDQAIPRPYE